MLLTVLKSKIHRATVTEADLHYVGSITIDQDLIDAAGLIAGELVQVVDVTNGARLSTYVIEGVPGSGVIGINGAAAHLIHQGDTVIIMNYALMKPKKAKRYRPKIVHVDHANRIVQIGQNPAVAVTEGTISPTGAANLTEHRLNP